MSQLDEIRAILCASDSDDVAALVRGLVLHAVQGERRLAAYRQAMSEILRSQSKLVPAILARADEIAARRPVA